MTNVTIIGATGSLGRATTKTLLAETDANLTLFSRTANRLADHDRVKKIAASTADTAKLVEAVTGADLVFAALSGDLANMANQIIQAMQTAGSKRLVFISSYGIYGEIEGRGGNGGGILAPYRKAADIVEGSGLEYTVIRPGWFDNSSDLSFTLYPKGETIYGNDISRGAIAKLVKQMVEDPTYGIHQNWGIVR